MALIAIAADKGSPGVTTSAVALAAVWPRPVLLAECDPAGGDLAFRLPAADRGRLDPRRGLLSAAVAARRGMAPGQVWEHAQKVHGGLDVLAGVTNAEQGAGLESLWGTVGAVLAGVPQADVIADCGRTGVDGPFYDLLAQAATTVLVSGVSFGEIVRLRERAAALAAGLARRGRGGVRIPVVIVASPRHMSATLSEASQALGKNGPAVIIGGLAHDPRSAESLRGEWGGKLDKSMLIRTAREVAATIAGQLPPPVGMLAAGAQAPPPSAAEHTHGPARPAPAADRLAGPAANRLAGPAADRLARPAAAGPPPASRPHSLAPVAGPPGAYPSAAAGFQPADPPPADLPRVLPASAGGPPDAATGPRREQPQQAMAYPAAAPAGPPQQARSAPAAGPAGPLQQAMAYPAAGSAGPPQQARSAPVAVSAGPPQQARSAPAASPEAPRSADEPLPGSQPTAPGWPDHGGYRSAAGYADPRPGAGYRTASPPESGSAKERTELPPPRGRHAGSAPGPAEQPENSGDDSVTTWPGRPAATPGSRPDTVRDW